jgi:transposase
VHVADHLTLDRLRERVDAEPGRRLFVRLRAVLLAAEGRTAVEIVAALGGSRRAVQRWVARYNAEGPEALGDRPRPGQPGLLDEAAAGRLRQRIDAGPTPADGVCALRAKDIRSILSAEFGVLYSLPGVYALLHRMGYSCLDPRPRHRKADPAVQEEFKKKSAASSTTSHARTPGGGSRSGSRTRRGSASGGR